MLNKNVVVLLPGLEVWPTLQFPAPSCDIVARLTETCALKLVLEASSNVVKSLEAFDYLTPSDKETIRELTILNLKLKTRLVGIDFELLVEQYVGINVRESHSGTCIIQNLVLPKVAVEIFASLPMPVQVVFHSGLSTRQFCYSVAKIVEPYITITSHEARRALYDICSSMACVNFLLLVEKLNGVAKDSSVRVAFDGFIANVLNRYAELPVRVLCAEDSAIIAPVNEADHLIVHLKSVTGPQSSVLVDIFAFSEQWFDSAFS